MSTSWRLDSKVLRLALCYPTCLFIFGCSRLYSHRQRHRRRSLLSLLIDASDSPSHYFYFLLLLLPSVFRSTYCASVRLSVGELSPVNVSRGLRTDFLFVCFNKWLACSLTRPLVSTQARFFILTVRNAASGIVQWNYFVVSAKRLIYFLWYPLLEIHCWF